MDYTKAATASLTFTEGYAELLRDATLYADAALSDALGSLAKGGVVEAEARSNAGESNDALRVSFQTEAGKVTGYVAAEDLRPMSEDEVAAYRANEKQPDYAPVVAATEAPATEAPATEAPATEAPATEAPATEVPATEVPVTEVPVTEVPAEENAAQADVVDAPVLMGAPMLMALPGATTLTANVTTNVTVGNYAQTAYASFNMTAAGMLTMVFKSSGNAAGNLEITIRSASDNDAVLWTGVLKPQGTVNFSSYVESGDYDVIYSKSDAADYSAYTVATTPNVSNTGELGTRNNTMNNAATLTVNNSSASTGIYSIQDKMGGKLDYYRFTLSSAGKLTFSASNMTTGEIDFYVYGDDTSTGNVLSSMNIKAAGAPSQDTTVTYHRSGWFDAGVYYIVVDASEVGRYNLKVDLSAVTLTEKEPNNTFSAAYSSGNSLNLLTGLYVTGMLSESDGTDYYYFSLPYEQTVDFSVKVQFAGVNLAVYTPDGAQVSGSSFGKTGVPGSEGNPYELELRNLRLPAGSYYLCVSWDESKHTGLYSVAARSVLTASQVTATVTNGNQITMTGLSSGGTSAATLNAFYVYYNDPNTGALQLVHSWSSATERSTTYAAPATGTYSIQYWVTNGTVASDKWTTVKCTTTSFAITSLSAKANEKGQIVCTATTNSTSPLQSSVIALLRNGEVVEMKSLNGATTYTFQAPISDTYYVQFVASANGVQYAEAWTNVDVVVPGPVLPVEITKLTVSSNSAGEIACSAAVKNGYALQRVGFYLYRNGLLMDAYETTNTLQHTFKVSQSGAYTVQCVVNDGVSATDAWGNVTVAPGATLSITDMNVTANSAGVLSFNASTQNGGKLLINTFYVYLNGVLLGSVNAVNGSGTATVYQDGEYYVQYVAYDGVTAVDRWASVKVTLSSANQPVSVQSVKATATSAGRISIDVTTAGSRPLTQLDYYLYLDGEIVNVTRTTSTKNCTFYVKKSGNYYIQVIASDGIQYVDGWTNLMVNVEQTPEENLMVTSLEAKYDGKSGITVNAATNFSTPLVISDFYLYRNGVVVGKITAPNKSGYFTNLTTGTYYIQYVVYDGKTAADKWVSVTVGASSLKVNSVSASWDAAKGQLTCSATITQGFAVQSAGFYAYKNGVVVASWDWEGTGDYLNHVFTLGDVKPDSVQFVIFDSVSAVDGWKIL